MWLLYKFQWRECWLWIAWLCHLSTCLAILFWWWRWFRWELILNIVCSQAGYTLGWCSYKCVCTDRHEESPPKRCQQEINHTFGEACHARRARIWLTTFTITSKSNNQVIYSSKFSSFFIYYNVSVCWFKAWKHPERDLRILGQGDCNVERCILL